MNKIFDININNIDETQKNIISELPSWPFPSVEALIASACSIGIEYPVLAAIIIDTAISKIKKIVFFIFQLFLSRIRLVIKATSINRLND